MQGFLDNVHKEARLEHCSQYSELATEVHSWLPYMTRKAMLVALMFELVLELL